jgi:4-amino-4-deoxy-L-arabinose transferase-like glycosyltransferase
LIGGRRSKGLLVLAGLLFGVATLIKPQTIAFPLGAVIALVLVYRDYSWQRGLASGLIVYIALLLVVLPWSMRNLSVFNEFVLVSTNSGVSLIQGANDEMTGRDYAFHESETYSELGILWERHVERQVEHSKVMNEYAKNWIGDNTLEYISWMPKKVALLWVKDTDGFWAYDYSYPGAGVYVKMGQVINQIYYSVVLLLSLPAAFFALIALVRQSGTQMPLGLLFCFPVFVSLVASVFTGQIRYHFSAMPYLIIAAAWTVVWISSLVQQSKSRAVVAAE